MLICRSATVFENIKATREFTHLQIIIIHFISMVISILLFTCIIIVIIAIVIAILAISIPTEQCLPI